MHTNNQLFQLISQIREIGNKQAKLTLEDFEFLFGNEALLNEVRNEVVWLMTNTKWATTLSESGYGNNEFFSEISKKIAYRILPPKNQPYELQTYINYYFNKENDYLWLEKIEKNVWYRFFDLLSFEGNSNTKLHIKREHLNTLYILTYKVASLGIDKEIVSKLPQIDELDSPFLGLNRETIYFIEKELQNKFKEKKEKESDIKQILILLAQCKANISSLYKYKDKYGISLNFTLQIRKLEKYIAIIEHILKLNLSLETKQVYDSVINLTLATVKNQNLKYSIGHYFSQNVTFISFKIVENTSRKGEDYIADSKKQYWDLFKKALGGGVVVAFLCTFKTLIYYLKLPIIWEGLFYSLNYSLGFMLIHVFRFTLATKQPAMTASTIASSFSNTNTDNWIKKPVELLTRITRSQFVSLLGNAIIAFPVAFLIDFIVFYILGVHIATPEKSEHMIHELNPFTSLLILHAFIAGIYLSISGLIAGYYENKWVFNDLKYRILAIGLAKNIFGPKKLAKIVNYLDKNFGSLMGNFFLGIFLGSTASVGKMIGLPLDIRHITFASGNFGLAFAGSAKPLSPHTISISVLGIALIGLVNVIVSFGLSIFFAAKSRNISTKRLISVLKNLFLHFFTNGKSFFLPTNDKLSPN